MHTLIEIQNISSLQQLRSSADKGQEIGQVFAEHGHRSARGPPVLNRKLGFLLSVSRAIPSSRALFRHTLKLLAQVDAGYDGDMVFVYVFVTKW